LGNYTGGKSEGVYVYKFNSSDGSFKEISHVKTSNPSFVAVSPNEKMCIAVQGRVNNGKGGEISAFSLTKNRKLHYLNEEPTEGDPRYGD
jgi:6-phosphogluconolactonase